MLGCAVAAAAMLGVVSNQAFAFDTVEAEQSATMQAEWASGPEDLGGHCASTSTPMTAMGGVGLGSLCSKTIQAYQEIWTQIDDAADDYYAALEAGDTLAAASAARRIIALAEDLDDLRGRYVLCLNLFTATLGH